MKDCNNQVFFTQCKETGIFGLSRIFALSFCEAWMVAETQIKASWICSLWNFCRSCAGSPCYVFVFYVNKQINGNGDCCHSFRSELSHCRAGHLGTWAHQGTWAQPRPEKCSRVQIIVCALQLSIGAHIH